VSGGNLELDSTSSSPSRLSASNVILRESLHDGFTIDEGTNLVVFDNITSTLNSRTGVVAASKAHQFGQGVSFVGSWYSASTNTHYG